MTAKLARLLTDPERMSREGALRAIAVIEALPDEEMGVIDRQAAVRALFRKAEPAASTEVWPGGFSMLSREWTWKAWQAIRALDTRFRPQDVRAVFDVVVLNIRRDTGEVMLRREEIASLIGPKFSASRVSLAMSVLCELGLVRREVRGVSGLKGHGVAVYFVTPFVAWQGDLELRSAAAADQSAPLLKLMEGDAR